MVSLACCMSRDILAKILASSRVGGIVSETNLKFFLQFVSYVSLYWLHILGFMAVFVAEIRSEVSGHPSVVLYNEDCASAGFVGAQQSYIFTVIAYLLCLLLVETTINSHNVIRMCISIIASYPTFHWRP